MAKRKTITNQTSKVENKPRFLFYESTSIKAKVAEQFKTEDVQEEQQLISKNIRSKLGEEHPFEYNQVRELMKRFGLVNAVVDKYTDFMVGAGISVECEDERGKQILKEWIENTQFNLYLTPWAKSALGVGTGYLEIAGLSDKSKDNMIKTASPDTIFIVKDKYGKVKKINQ